MIIVCVRRIPGLDLLLHPSSSKWAIRFNFARVQPSHIYINIYLLYPIFPRAVPTLNLDRVLYATNYTLRVDLHP